MTDLSKKEKMLYFYFKKFILMANIYWTRKILCWLERWSGVVWCGVYERKRERERERVAEERKKRIRGERDRRERGRHFYCFCYFLNFLIIKWFFISFNNTLNLLTPHLLLYLHGLTEKIENINGKLTVGCILANKSKSRVVFGQLKN